MVALERAGVKVDRYIMKTDEYCDIANERIAQVRQEENK